VLQDEGIKKELVRIIADNVAGQLGRDPIETRSVVAGVAGTKQGAALMAGIIHDAHARLIGERQAPVQITSAQLVELMRTQAVGDLPTITLPVPKVTALDLARRALQWILPIAAIATLVFTALAFTAHPERSALFKSLALGLLLLGVLVALLGYVVPKFVVPALSDSVWANAPAQLVDDSVPLLIGLELLLVGGAAALFAGTGIVRRRRRWSAPVNTARYNDEQRW